MPGWFPKLSLTLHTQNNKEYIMDHIKLYSLFSRIGVYLETVVDDQMSKGPHPTWTLMSKKCCHQRGPGVSNGIAGNFCRERHALCQGEGRWFCAVALGAGQLSFNGLVCPDCASIPTTTTGPSRVQRPRSGSWTGGHRDEAQGKKSAVRRESAEIGQKCQHLGRVSSAGNLGC